MAIVSLGGVRRGVPLNLLMSAAAVGARTLVVEQSRSSAPFGGAALLTLVRKRRGVPGSRIGEPIIKRFRIPIRFSCRTVGW